MEVDLRDWNTPEDSLPSSSGITIIVSSGLKNHYSRVSHRHKYAIPLLHERCGGIVLLLSAVRHLLEQACRQQSAKQ